jgi:hypothetical protein
LSDPISEGGDLEIIIAIVEFFPFDEFDDDFCSCYGEVDGISSAIDDE